MNRRSFVRAATAAVPGLIVSAPLIAALAGKRGPGAAYKVGSGKDRTDSPLSLFEGDTFFTKVSGKDSNGALYLFESVRIKQGGPALHVHYEEDEWFYILSGDFLIKVGDTTYEATAGDSVFGPRRVPHVWAKTSDGPARMLMAFVPAGKMEDYFRAVADGRVAKMSPAEQEAFRRQHGFERLGPALFHHKQ